MDKTMLAAALAVLSSCQQHDPTKLKLDLTPVKFFDYSAEARKPKPPEPPKPKPVEEPPPKPKPRVPGLEYYEDKTTWAERDAYAWKAYQCLPVIHYSTGDMICAIGPIPLTNMNGASLVSAYLMRLPGMDHSEMIIGYTMNCDNGLVITNIVGGGSNAPGYSFPLPVIRKVCELAWNRGSKVKPIWVTLDDEGGVLGVELH